MKKSPLLGALCAVLFTFVTMPVNALLLGLLPATPGGADWQAAYDVDRNVTWVANANLAATTNFGVSGINGNGTMIWNKANEWVGAMNTANYLGLNNWRLPTTLQPDITCALQSGGSFGTGCTGSEMGHLANIEGVNSDGGTTAVVLGVFSNVQSIPYWSSSEFAPDPTDAWTLSFNGGDQRIGGKDSFNSVWALRNGAPEPITLLEVDYSVGTINSGGLTGGLSSLPNTVKAAFALDGHLGSANLNLGLSDLAAFSLNFGDFNYDLAGLDSFSLITDATGAVTTLSYTGNERSDSGIIILNNAFSLTIQGDDDGTGNAFEYFYSESAQSISAVPVPAAVWLFGSGLLGLIGIARRKKPA